MRSLKQNIFLHPVQNISLYPVIEKVLYLDPEEPAREGLPIVLVQTPDRRRSQSGLTSTIRLC